VRNLEPAAVNLSNATPHLSQVFNVLNHLFNDLAYHPGGGQHGYLWWLAWASHNARTVFATQDANGDFRQLFLQASCASLTQISNNVPGSAAVLPVVSALSSSGLCSPQATALNKAFARYQQNPHLVPEAPSVSALATGKAAKELFYPKLPTN
jgi:hypothetical protein